MNDCLFCKIIANEIPSQKIYESDDFVAFLDIKPVNLGHALIVPKNHYRNLLDMPKELLEKTGPLVQKIADAVKEGTGAGGINIGWNNEAAAGQIIFHSHIHVIPRFTKDKLRHWPGKEVGAESLETIAQKIKKRFKFEND